MNSGLRFGSGAELLSMSHYLRLEYNDLLGGSFVESGRNSRGRGKYPMHATPWETSMETGGMRSHTIWLRALYPYIAARVKSSGERTGKSSFRLAHGSARLVPV